MKKHNYSAGPCILPQEVFEKSAQAVLNFNQSGLSILEISHRSKDFVAVMDEARALALELLGLQGKGYQALFLQGGASLEFLMVPYNLMKVNGKAAYLDTGTWANSAIKEAKAFGETVVVASSKPENYNHIPKGYNVPSDADYFHCTSNNTIFGCNSFKKFSDLLILVLLNPLNFSLDKYLVALTSSLVEYLFSIISSTAFDRLNGASLEIIKIYSSKVK